MKKFNKCHYCGTELGYYQKVFKDRHQDKPVRGLLFTDCTNDKCPYHMIQPGVKRKNWTELTWFESLFTATNLPLDFFKTEA